MKNGIVYFVGAGPGDPGLITVKGKQALEKADIILYDRLANPKFLEYASPDCRFIYCGKLPDRHFMKQSEINALLIEKAAEGCTVVRLKGGDPCSAESAKKQRRFISTASATKWCPASPRESQRRCMRESPSPIVISLRPSR